MHGWLLQKPVPKMGQIQKGSQQIPLAALEVSLDQRVNKEQILICSMKSQPWHLKGSRELPGTKGLYRSDGISRDIFRIFFFFQGLPPASAFLEPGREALLVKHGVKQMGTWSHFLPFSAKCLPLLQTKLKFPKGMESMEVSGTFCLCYLWKRQSLGLDSRNMISSSSKEKETW